MVDLIYRFDPKDDRGRRAPADAKEAWQRLEEGNRTFSSLDMSATGGLRIMSFEPEDIGIAGPGNDLRQKPFAAVLGCSDARVPTELIFDCACNELFVVRVAGNVLDQAELGSIDYAVEHLAPHLKLLVVLGHSQCGAVTAAVDAFLAPSQYLGLLSSHHVRSIVNGLFPAVRGAATALEEEFGKTVSRKKGYRAALIEISVVLNAALTASILKQEFCRPPSECKAVFGIYDIGSRHVHVPLTAAATKERATKLIEAPVGQEEFRKFAAKVVHSSFVKQLLSGK